MTDTELFRINAFMVCCYIAYECSEKDKDNGFDPINAYLKDREDHLRAMFKPVLDNGTTKDKARAEKTIRNDIKPLKKILFNLRDKVRPAVEGMDLINDKRGTDFQETVDAVYDAMEKQIKNRSVCYLSGKE